MKKDTNNILSSVSVNSGKKHQNAFAFPSNELAERVDKFMDKYPDAVLLGIYDGRMSAIRIHGISVTVNFVTEEMRQEFVSYFCNEDFVRTEHDLFAFWEMLLVYKQKPSLPYSEGIWPVPGDTTRH